MGERKTLKRVQKGKNRSQRKPVENGTPEVQQPENDVLQLQHTFGNRHVTQIAATNSLPASNLQRSVIQRKETGIRSKTATSAYTKTIFDYCQEPTNQTKTIADFKQVLEDTVNSELKAATSSEITIVDGAPGASGEFDFSTWAIELNEATAFPGATTLADLTEDQIRDTADTVYHEARHSEQWFRMARNRAGKALNDKSTNDDRQDAADTIADEMGIPVNVALEACNNPLQASWISKFFGIKDKSIEEAEAWDKSIYGADSNYRDEIVLGDFSTDVESMYEHLQAAIDEYPSDYEDLPEKDKKPVRAAARIERKKAEPIFKRVVKAKKKLLRPEIKRITAIRKKTAVDNIMLGHLNTVTEKIEAMEEKFPTNHYTKLKDATAISEEMKDEMYQAYRDLPEEADAWPTGEAVSAEYDSLANTTVEAE